MIFFRVFFFRFEVFREREREREPKERKRKNSHFSRLSPQTQKKKKKNKSNQKQIDRLAKEGIKFTDYYGEQSCTAGRAAFLTGMSPYRSGLTKVGMPGAKVGLSGEDCTLATAMRAAGLRTGQFGKNHLGDLDEYLPTNHGFQEFFGEGVFIVSKESEFFSSVGRRNKRKLTPIFSLLSRLLKTTTTKQETSTT